MKKKMITLLLAGIMAFSLSACGETQDTNEDKKETNADTETTPQAEKTEDDKNTLMVWAWDQNFNIYAMKEAEKIYQKDQAGHCGTDFRRCGNQDRDRGSG